jgi:hypothetical protein
MPCRPHPPTAQQPTCRWPWDKYRGGLSQPPGGPQRTFLVLVLQHLVRLTAWDHQMLLQETPPEFLALLGEQPVFHGLPKPEPYPPPPKPPALPPPAAAPAAGDEAMAEADGAAAAAAGDKDGEDAADDAAADDAMQQDEQQQQEAAEKAEQEQQQQPPDGDEAMQDAGEGQQQQQDEPPADPELVWAGKLLGVMQARPPPQHKPLSYKQVLEWVDQQQVISACRPAAHEPHAGLHTAYPRRRGWPCCIMPLRTRCLCVLPCLSEPCLPGSGQVQGASPHTCIPCCTTFSFVPCPADGSGAGLP